MAFCSFALLALAFAPFVSARRIESLERDTDTSNATAEVFVAAAGAVLDEQYQFIELLRGSGYMRVDEEYLRTDDEQGSNLTAQPGGWPRQFRELASKYGSNPKRAGEGAFGEVWLAKDIKSGKNVAVKLFKNGRGGYIMCGEGAGQERMQYMQLLKDASDECRLSQKLTMGSEAKRDPVGASRIAMCLRDEVRDKLSARQTTACYIVLENGGVPLDKWVDDHRGRGKNDPHEARIIIKQILEAVKFMNRFRPAYIHHDMKPDNTVYSIEDGFPVVKLIDWGCAIKADNPYQESQVDPTYAPPEYTATHGTQAFAKPAHSFDMFQVGLTYLELLCPDLHVSRKSGVDGFGRPIPRKLWFPQYARLQAEHFRRAGCCVDDSNPDKCVTNDDINIMRHLFGHSSTRPHPNKVLHTPTFHNLMTQAETDVETKFDVGEVVEYRSSTHRAWVLTEITAVYPDGTYEIARKPGRKVGEEVLRSPETAPTVECPPGSIPFTEGACICDAEGGFVLAKDKKNCVLQGVNPELETARPPPRADAEWCRGLREQDCFSPFMRKNCPASCKRLA